MSNPYLTTVQIVGGILTPIAIVLLLGIVKSSINMAAKIKDEVTQARREEPPFKVRLEEAPNPHMLKVVLEKEGEVIYKVGVDKV